MMIDIDMCSGGHRKGMLMMIEGLRRHMKAAALCRARRTRYPDMFPECYRLH